MCSHFSCWHLENCEGPSGKISFDDLKAVAKAQLNDRQMLDEPGYPDFLEATFVSEKRWPAVSSTLEQELGETMSDEELQEMIREADKDDDGEVQWREKLSLLTRAMLKRGQRRRVHANHPKV